MDQQRAKRVSDLVSRRQIDVLDRLDRVEHAADMHVEPGRAQRLAERQQVVEEAIAPHA
jgi:hypothetical protein